MYVGLPGGQVKGWWPFEFEAFIAKTLLEIRKDCADATGPNPPFQTKGGEAARSFPDVPFDRVNPKATVGNMRDPEILCSRQEVVDAHRQ